VNEKELNRLAYALFRGINGFREGLKEYDEGKIMGREIIMRELGYALNEVIAKYNFSFHDFFNLFIPEEYKPLMKVFERMKVEEMASMVSEVVKEYAKEDTHKSLEEIILKAGGKVLFKKMLGG